MASALTFSHFRHIQDASDLGDIHRAQLQLAGQAWDGRDLGPEERLDEEPFNLFTFLWDLNADGKTLFEAWFYCVDSGTIFEYGTTKVVAQVIQQGLECENRDLRAQIHEAARMAFAETPEAKERINISVPS